MPAFVQKPTERFVGNIVPHFNVSKSPAEGTLVNLNLHYIIINNLYIQFGFSQILIFLRIPELDFYPAQVDWLQK